MRYILSLLIVFADIAFADEANVESTHDRVSVGISLPLSPIPLLGSHIRHFINRSDKAEYAETTQYIGGSIMITSSKWALLLDFQHSIPTLIWEGRGGFDNIEIKQTSINASIIYNIFDIGIFDIYAGPDYLFNDFELNFNSDIFNGGGLKLGISYDKGIMLDYSIITNINYFIHTITFQTSNPILFTNPVSIFGGNIGIEFRINDDYKSVRLFIELGLAFNL